VRQEAAVRPARGLGHASRVGASGLVILAAATLAGCFGTGARGGAACDPHGLRPKALSAKKVRLLGVRPRAGGSAIDIQAAGKTWVSLNRGRTWRRFAPGIDVLELDRANPDRMFALASPGLLRSVDRGRHWSRVNLPRCAFPDGVLTTSDPAVLYAWAESGITSDDPWIQGIFRSTDGGRSFKKIAGYDPNDVLVDPRDPNTVFVAAQGGFFKTTNGGGDWTRLKSRAVYQLFWEVAVAAANDQTVYAIGDGFKDLDATNGEGGNTHVLVASSDGGTTWRKKLEIFDLSGLTVDPRAPQKLYVFGERLGPNYGVLVLLKSTDGGKHWRQIAQRVPGSPHIPPSSDRRDPHALESLIVDPARRAVLYGRTLHGIARSTTDGRSWRFLRLPRL
jgi:photosystem II stability/assembly factor-like uncharacterized protein